jgi:hypothetical protein
MTGVITLHGMARDLGVATCEPRTALSFLSQAASTSDHTISYLTSFNPQIILIQSFQENQSKDLASSTSNMSADTSAPLSKVDSAVSGLSSSPPDEKKTHRRASSSVTGVYNINDLGMLTIQ